MVFAIRETSVSSRLLDSLFRRLQPQGWIVHFPESFRIQGNDHIVHKPQEDDR